MQNLLSELDGVPAVTTDMYKSAETLLDLYKKVHFRVQVNMADIDTELYNEERKHLTDMIHEIIDFDTTHEKRRIQERLMSNNFTLCLLEIMEDSLLLLKQYPDDGELYYQLLRYRYFEPLKVTNEEVMEMMDLPYTTYFRKRKKAIQLYAAMIWGMTKQRMPAENGGTEMEHCWN